MSLKRKDLLSLALLSVDEIMLVLATADSFKEVTGQSPGDYRKANAKTC